MSKCKTCQAETPDLCVCEKGKQEKWRQVPGYEGIYEISSMGRVKSLACGAANVKILKSGISKFGYISSWLSKNKEVKAFRNHRLVASAFLPNPNKYPAVNHINGIRSDNHVLNLEWCTHSYNSLDAANRMQQQHNKRAGSCKLTANKVLLIREMNAFCKKSFTCRWLAKCYRVHSTTVEYIVNGKTWRHLIPKQEKHLTK